jgi:Glycosyltransferases, probably involved in cell wall biogenesis
MKKNPTLPKISIVVPSLNAASTIQRTLNSLALQNYLNLQVICVDGNSKDETVLIIKTYKSLVSTIISEPDKNVADAINKGFRIADGEFFGWLNADDELAPGALFHFVEVFRDHPEADLVTGGCRRFYPDGSEVITQVRTNFQEIVSLLNGIEQPSTLWRSEIHRRAGELDTSFVLAFDWEWWNRLNALGIKFVATDFVLSHYHFSDFNKTSVGGRAQVREMYRVTKRYGPYRGLIADLYYLLYKVFDVRGFYDHPNNLSKWKMNVFYTILGMFCTIFGATIVKSYNWNFASKQERGICWYK